MKDELSSKFLKWYILCWLIALLMVALLGILVGRAHGQELQKTDKPKPTADPKIVIKPPSIGSDEKIKIRELQLKDNQITVEIQKRQLEIYQLRDIQTQNTAELNTFKGGLCKPSPGDTNSYFADLQSIQCVQLDQPGKGGNFTITK